MKNETCSECNKMPGTIPITCSAHKERYKVCAACWSTRPEQDRCSEPECHGRVHAVRRSMVLRSYDYFARKGKEVGKFSLFMFTILMFSVLIVGPMILISHKSDTDETPQSAMSDISEFSVFILLSHAMVYTSFCLFFIVGCLIEWIEARSHDIRDFCATYRVPVLVANVYCTELVLCGALHAAPAYGQQWIYLANVYLLLMDVFYLWWFRRPLRIVLYESKDSVYSWFMEEREEHLFLEEEEAT